MSNRPAWRYRTRRGWNYLALAWYLVGMISALIANWAFSPWNLPTNRHAGAVTMMFGLVVFVVDLVCRVRDDSLSGASRFFLPEAGGAFLSVPVWAMAIFIMGTAIAVLLGAP